MRAVIGEPFHPLHRTASEFHAPGPYATGTGDNDDGPTLTQCPCSSMRRAGRPAAGSGPTW